MIQLCLNARAAQAVRDGVNQDSKLALDLGELALLLARPAPASAVDDSSWPELPILPAWIRILRGIDFEGRKVNRLDGEPNSIGAPRGRP